MMIADKEILENMKMIIGVMIEDKGIDMIMNKREI